MTDTEFFHETMPFTKALGIEVDEYGPDEVRASLAWDPTRCTSGGVLHGGVLMALADSCGGGLAFANLPDGATTTTIESSTKFLRPVREGRVHATTRPLHRGRRFIVIDTLLTDDDGKLVGRVTQTQAILT